MKSFKWFVCCMMMLAIYFTPISAFAIAQISWSYNGSLATPIPSVTSGWLVEMYRDVGGNTVLGSITSFNSSDIPQGASANASDDVLLGASFQTTVNGSFNWSATPANSISGARVYSVLFNNSVLTAATQAWIIDTTPTTIGAGPFTYTANATINSIGSGPLTVVPEPSSLALVGVGLAAIALRRRYGK
ncbi:MAG: PEP-CTERM sorting domain-containing protein [bacterium]